MDVTFLLASLRTEGSSVCSCDTPDIGTLFQSSEIKILMWFLRLFSLLLFCVIWQLCIYVSGFHSSPSDAVRFSVQANWFSGCFVWDKSMILCRSYETFHASYTDSKRDAWGKIVFFDHLIIYSISRGYGVMPCNHPHTHTRAREKSYLNQTDD
jgi:hypothetical protein